MNFRLHIAFKKRPVRPNIALWSDNFLDGIADVYKRRGGLLPQKPSLCQQKPRSPDVYVNGSTQSKVKETKLKKTKEYTSDFLVFWNLYPYKEKKFKAFEAWQKMNGSSNL